MVLMVHQDPCLLEHLVVLVVQLAPGLQDLLEVLLGQPDLVVQEQL